MTMTKRRLSQRQTTLTAVALAAALPVMGPPSAALAQGLLNSFDVGGGLLPAPPPDSALTAGTGAQAVAPATGGPAATNAQRGTNAVDQGTGPVFTASVFFGYTYEDPEDEPNESFLSNRFDLGIFTETRNQSFQFNVGGDARLEESMSGITNPFARLDYTIGNRSTQLAFDLDWRESDVADQFLPADFDSDDLLIDGGTQEEHAARITLTTGRDRRFGTITSLGFSQIDYTDTVDPDLFNEETFDASTQLRFSIDRRIELTVFANWSERSEDDAVQTVETDINYGFGLDLLIDRAWTGTVDLAITSEETETTGGDTDEDGYQLDLGLVRDMRNGTLAFNLSRDVDDGDDGVNTLTATRRLTLANGAAVSGTVGFVTFDGGDVLASYGATYRHEILRGSVVAAALERTGGQTEDDENVLRTTFNASLQQELTRNSSLSLTGALASVENQSVADPDTLAASFGLSYNHALTEDWGLVAQANTILNYEDGSRTDRENSFSIGLQRTFSFRP